MNRFCKVSVFCFSLLLFACISVVCAAPLHAEKKIDVLFTHDVHSFLEQSARIKTVIDKQKETKPNTFVLDAGDFSMGTLYQTVFASEAAELRIFGALGVDVTTLGNHEFDYGTEALASMFRAACKSGSALPLLTVCNIDWSKTNEDTALLKQVFAEYGERDYVMLEKNGVRMAVIGVFGKDALFCAPSCKISFLDPVESVRRCVDEIRQNEQADIIVCVSHSGTNAKPSKSEDLQLAQKVPELDFIISGHTHTVLQEPLICGETYIVSCGAYNRFLGSFSMTQKENGRWLMDAGSYNLLSVPETTKKDATVEALLNDFKYIADKEYFSAYGYTSDQVLAVNAFDASSQETGGYAIGDGFRYAAEKYVGIKADAAVVPSGVMRCGYDKGNISTSLVYQSYALGTGADKKSGYPLLAVYLTGKELKTVAEIDASVSKIMDTARLYMSGLVYEYNPYRLFLDRVTNVYLEKQDGSLTLVEPDALYCVLCDSYSGQMLDGVTKLTHGLVSIKPKDASGNALTDFSTAVLHTQTGELKAWQAIAAMMHDKKTLADYSDKNEASKIAVPSVNPFEYFASPSVCACLLYTFAVLIIALIAMIIRIVYRLRKKA